MGEDHGDEFGLPDPRAICLTCIAIRARQTLHFKQIDTGVETVIDGEALAGLVAQAPAET
jgi:hypothetical protein